MATTALVIRKWETGTLAMPDGFDLVYDTGEVAPVRQNATSNGRLYPGDEVDSPIMAGGYVVVRDDLWGYAVLLVHGPDASMAALGNDPDTFKAWSITTLRAELGELMPAGVTTTINQFLTNNGQQNIPNGWTVAQFLRRIVGDRLDTTKLGGAP